MRYKLYRISGLALELLAENSTLEVVNELAAAGIVSVTPAGRALMVSLNRDHLAIEPILGLVGLRARLVERLASEVAGWSNLAGGWLFGSAARGDGDVTSDIDVLLVADHTLDEHWESACARLTTQVRDWTGNATQLVDHTRPSFAVLVKRRNPIIAALRSEGIPLTPTSPKLLRGAA